MVIPILLPSARLPHHQTQRTRSPQHVKSHGSAALPSGWWCTVFECTPSSYVGAVAGGALFLRALRLHVGASCACCCRRRCCCSCRCHCRCRCRCCRCRCCCAPRFRWHLLQSQALLLLLHLFLLLLWLLLVLLLPVPATAAATAPGQKTEHAPRPITAKWSHICQLGYKHGQITQKRCQRTYGKLHTNLHHGIRSLE